MEDGDVDLVAELPRSEEFIERAKAEGGKVMVHCQAGISRSASIVIGYLMRTQSRTLKDALFFVKDRRSQAGPNVHFCTQLGEMEVSSRPTAEERALPPSFTVADCFTEELLQMGFDRQRAEKAVAASGGRWEQAVQFCLSGVG
eukprot:Hpha_TRINITY_DN9730_c0_g1::TRINITY_DN9730_c0_g1_i1::g.10260::m.10260